MAERCRIYLRGGQTVVLEANKFTVVKNGLGAVTRLRWEGPINAEPLYFDPEAIDVLTVENAPDLSLPSMVGRAPSLAPVGAPKNEGAWKR